MEIPGLPERYSVHRRVGAGGMGEVFEATDRVQDRRVAIKLTAPHARERGAREIAAVARLNHPHIVPLFDSGEADGRSYFVMPFIEGPSLRDALVADGPFPLDRALQVVHDVGSALRYAHSQGLVHRDVKPSNVLFSQGTAVLADFGVVGGSRFREPLTESGSGIGTPAYASPGQMSGAEPATPATDVYALACVLFEMLTGKPPFAGSSAEIILARKVSSAPSLRDALPDISPRIDAAVARALAPSAADRYDGVGDFLDALEVPGPARGGSRRTFIAAGLLLIAVAVAAILARGDAGPSPPITTIAVSPLTAGHPEEEMERVRSLAERVRRGLAALGGLTVLGPRPPGTTGAAPADAEIEVTIERSADGGERFVFTADRLGTEAWRQAFRVPPTEVGDLQIPSAVVRSIAPILDLRPSEEVLAGIDAPATDDAEAWRLYQVATRLYGRSARLEDRLEAVRLLEEAVELDPAFSEAYAKAGEILAVVFDLERDPTLVARANRHIERALELEPDLPEGHLAAATLRFVQGGFRQARLALDRAIELGPSRNDAGWLRSVFLRREGRWDAAVESFEEVVSWDPGHRVWVLGLGRTLLWLGDYPRAIAAFDRSIALGPDARDAPYLDKAWTLAVAGHPLDSVVSVVREAARVAGREPTLGALVTQHAERGWFWWLPGRLIGELGPVQGGEPGTDPDRYLALSALGAAAGDTAARRTYADSARIVLERELPGRLNPDIRSKLGIANALAGNRPEALRWAEEGLERRRAFRDAYNGPISLLFLAQVHALNGETSRAGAYLDTLLAAPSPYSRRLFDDIWRLTDSIPRTPAARRD